MLCKRPISPEDFGLPITRFPIIRSRQPPPWYLLTTLEPPFSEISMLCKRPTGVRRSSDHPITRCPDLKTRLRVDIPHLISYHQSAMFYLARHRQHHHHETNMSAGACEI
jgi:hypothetical protein